MKFLNWFGRLLIGCFGIAAAWGAWYVVYQSSLDAIQEQEVAQAKKLLAVEVVPAQIDQIDEQIVLVGSFLPRAQTEVRSKLSGYIKSLPFDIGDRVEVGETICVLDDTDQNKEIEKARAALKVAQAQLEVRIEETRLAKQNADFEAQLAKSNAGTTQQADSSLAAYHIAMANEELDRARVAEAEEFLSSIQKGLADLTLVSPLTGYISERIADIGDLAKPDVALLRIVDLETVQTTVQVIEKDYHRVAVGQTAMVSVDAYPGQYFNGMVKRISPVLDAASRTASVHIDVRNSKLLLKPGMYGRVSLNPGSKTEGVVIPLAAVINAGSRTLVYVVNRETSLVEQRDVKLGLSNGMSVAVRSGISDDELVITLGNRLVQPNQQVALTEVPWPVENALAGDDLSQVSETISGD